jgi:hypothetical protein
MSFLTNYSCLSKIKVHSINIWTVKIKIAVVRLVKITSYFHIAQLLFMIFLIFQTIHLFKLTVK